MKRELKILVAKWFFDVDVRRARELTALPEGVDEPTAEVSPRRWSIHMIWAQRGPPAYSAFCLRVSPTRSAVRSIDSPVSTHTPTASSRSSSAWSASSSLVPESHARICS
jgi:hypothetical protein